MRVARCDSKCDGYSPIDECMENCLITNYTKPGYCPEENSMSPFEAACLVACSSDSQCSDLSKCCINDCGITCMKPTGLDERTDLPPIPDNIEIRREKSNMISLSWGIKTSKDMIIKSTKAKKDWMYDEQSSIRYLVEERHVLGPRYLESRLSSWFVRHLSSKPHTSIRSGLKTGHWYQFRVAAVNEYGSKGYSPPSIPFKTAEPKSPREPRNLSLSGARVHSDDGKLRILLKWKQPPSDVPIMFYKLYWSRLIRGPTNDSILVNHRSVPKDKNCYEIKNLEIGCQYFLQVQAVSLYGGRKLASKKASKVFNSTDYAKYVDVAGQTGRCDKHDAGLRVKRLICQCESEIEARLAWPVDNLAGSYNISWRQDKSSTLQNLVAKTYITQKTHYNIKGLRKNCTYVVNVQSIANDIQQIKSKNWPHYRTLEIEFITKNCQQRQNNNNQNEIETFKCKRRKARIKKINNDFV